MNDITNLEYQEGISLYKQGEKYNSPKLKTATQHRGYTSEERRSRCGYLQLHWNKTGGYKTSADLSTMFT